MRFSVVTATKNRQDWIQGCVACVQAQTFTDWEQIVYDVSDQPIRDLIDPDDRRIVYLRGESRGLTLDSMSALRYAGGDIVTLLHDDDRLPPDALTIVDKKIGAADWLVGRTMFLDPDGLLMYHRGGLTGYLQTVAGKMMMGAAVYWRRRFLVDLGGLDPDYDGAQDFELYLRMARAAKPRIVEDVLHIYNDHPGAYSNVMRQHQHEQCVRISSLA